MKTSTLKFTLNLLLPALCAVTSTAGDVTYEFTKIMESSDEIATVWPAGLNNNGQVLLYTETPEGQPALWLQDQGERTLVVRGVEPFSIGISGRPLNDSGRVGFTLSDTDPGNGEGRTRMIVAKGKTWNTIAEGHASDPVSFGAPAINNGGAVVFTTFNADDNRVSLVINQNGSRTTVVATEPGQPMVSSFDLNNDGAVAYNRFSVDTNNSGVYVWRAGQTQRVFDPIAQAKGRDLLLGPLTVFYYFSGVMMNDFGTVAFWNPGTECFRRADGTRGCGLGVSRIVRANAGDETTIASNTDSDDFKLDFTATPLNNRGDVLFTAHTGVGLSGPTSAYVGDGTTIRRVVGTGDYLWNQRIDYLVVAAINDRGQVLLQTYSDGDGRTVAVLATPRGQ